MTVLRSGLLISHFEVKIATNKAGFIGLYPISALSQPNKPIFAKGAANTPAPLGWTRAGGLLSGSWGS
jgi:hypothetical protein